VPAAPGSGVDEGDAEWLAVADGPAAVPEGPQAESVSPTMIATAPGNPRFTSVYAGLILRIRLFPESAM
jgi:hypothetical protein